jgi:predicted LPLAT superfamily acyltransferase/uncharacterized protein (DUF2062 family)
MILRACVVIPTFNNPRTISKVLKDVVTNTEFPVLVIDDGSETAVENVLYSFEVRQALEDGRIRLHRFAENRGKGAALRFAIEDLVARGFTHMVAMDGDGKHLAREIQKLVKIGKVYPWDLVITNRDTQSGFRMYPLFALQTMKFWTTGSDFEVEVLLRFLMRGISVRKTEVETRSPEITHFRSWGKRLHDRARFHALDTLLKTISLLKSRNSMGQIALAVGVGAFVSCTPFFGFHTLIIAGLAMILPLNFVAMFLGSHLTVAPLAPAVVIASLVIGKSIPGLKELEGPMSHFYQWLAGGAIFGLVAGTILGALTYAGIYSYRRSSRRLKDKRVSHHVRRMSLSVLTFCLRRFGMVAGRPAGLILSVFMWSFSRESRRALKEYLALTKPGLGRAERQKEIFEQLLAYNEARIDRLYNGLSDRSAFGVQPEGLAFVENTPSALTVSAHAGSARLAVELLDLPVRLLMCDRLRDGRTELLLFLGKLAPFDVSAFREAAETGRPVIFCFAVKRDGGYRFKAQSPRQFTFNGQTPRGAQVLEMAREFVNELENFVRANPRQWFNLFPFWSEVPANETTAISNHLFEELKPEAVSASGAAETNRSIRER